MTVQIDQIFTAKAENIWQFLNTAGQGCYIPAYQRPYAWDSGNVDRLVDDAIIGINHLLERQNAISFLGTVIAIHDITNVTVKPVYQSEVAQRVMTIIDGQQRISTSIMMNIALHNHIRQLLKKLGDASKSEFEWIHGQGECAIAELWTTFALDQNIGNPLANRYYPRVIRAFDDVWSKKGSQALYRSPIARLTWKYIQAHIDGTAEDFSYSASEGTENIDHKHKLIVSVFSYIKSVLAEMTAKKPDKYNYPDVQSLIAHQHFMKALWGYMPPDSVVEFITTQSANKNYNDYCALLRSLIFYKYYNTRMAWTIVTTRSEDDAFDMFEALNTTGEPLTAFETFKPKVIEAEGLENYENSDSHRNMLKIEEYLDAFKKADERQRATSELLIPLALGETGYKLQKNLGDQRRYLRDHIDSLTHKVEKRDVVASLASLASLLRTAWSCNESDCALEAFGKFDQETGFCFQSLKSLKHAVAIAPLSRFYDVYRRSSSESSAQSKANFISAIKATTTFSMLWRGGYGGTNNIDGVYRTIMRDGVPTISVEPLAKRAKNIHGKVCINNYKSALQNHLFSNFPDKESWVKSAARIPIYSNSAIVAKFLLIVASDDAVLDHDGDGLIVRGIKGVAPTVRSDAWGDAVLYTVEHIAPQSRKSEGWDEKIYDDPQTIHRLGNLTLLPSGINISMGNKSWEKKKQIYKYLSAETASEAEGIYATFPSCGLEDIPSNGPIIGTATYMPMCKAISRYSSDWSVDIIEQRSTRLAELAYDRIISWLKS